MSRRSEAPRPPFFYGWMMVPVAMVIHMATMPGQTFGIAVFNPYLLESLSLSHSELSGAYMLGTLLASIPMMYVGALMDRHGPRKTLIGVTILFGLTCIGMSQTQGLGSVFVCFLFLRMLGQGAMGLLAANAIAMWFNRRLGLVAGIISTGDAVSLGLFPTLNLLVIQAWGWRSAYATLGFGVWAVVLPLLAFVFRNRPEDVGQLVDGLPHREVPPSRENTETADNQKEANRDYGLREALRTRQYWILAIGMALPSMTITGIHFHAVQIYVDHGLFASDAAAMFTTFAISMSAMMLLGGVLADRIPLNLLLSASMACLTGGIMLLIQVVDSKSSNLFASTAGASLGLLSAVNATIWVRYYGRRHLGKIRGGLTTVSVASSGMGPFVMGAAHDLVGGYDQVLWLFVMMTAPMMVIALGATRPARLVKRN